jgi:hypothetical protein
MPTTIATLLDFLSKIERRKAKIHKRLKLLDITIVRNDYFTMLGDKI